MADEVDCANDRIIAETAFNVQHCCKVARAIPLGEPGECYYCGESFARVVSITDPATYDDVLACGRCRDKRGL